MPAAREALDSPFVDPDESDDSSDADELNDLGEADANAGIEDETLESARMRAHRLVADELYGVIPVSRWANALIDLSPFCRLDGVSLSDVPGEILFGDHFPSRLKHSLGVYYLARQARPRDRALQAAALAHDLGHGPFSHLSEPLMIERLGIDHEERSAALFRDTIASARGTTARLLAWLDVEEVSALITGSEADGRGALLNGSLDYDNLDNVSRFAFAAGLAEPGYDERALARALRVAPGSALVTLADEAQPAASAWQSDRATVYRFLQTDAWNISAHALLRKAIDLAATERQLDERFFDLTDDEALDLLGGVPVARPLVERVLAQNPYLVIWESVVAPENPWVPATFSTVAGRLTFEARVATEAGLRPSEIVAMYVISRVARTLPPLASQAGGIAVQTAKKPVERFVRLLAPVGLGRDYVRRARMAVERAVNELGGL
jgi:hypothetical protein